MKGETVPDNFSLKRLKQEENQRSYISDITKHKMNMSNDSINNGEQKKGQKQGSFHIKLENLQKIDDEYRKDSNKRTQRRRLRGITNRSPRWRCMKQKIQLRKDQKILCNRKPKKNYK